MSSKAITERAALAVAGMLLAAGCRDAAGPSALDSPDAIAMLASVAGDNGNGIGPHTLRQEDSTSVPQPYAVSLWVPSHEGRRVTVDYMNGGSAATEVLYDEDVGSHTFLSLYVPAGAIAQLPDGSSLSPGDSVEITVTIDPVLLYASMEPSGLVFQNSNPAELYVSYKRADRDYDGDGDEDGDDDLVERDYLGMWVRDGATDPWFPVTVVHSVPQRWFLGYLGHFSDHVISW